jgi:hypothetical protein
MKLDEIMGAATGAFPTLDATTGSYDPRQMPPPATLATPGARC